MRVEPSSSINEFLHVDGKTVKVVGTSSISEFVCVERDTVKVVASVEGA